MKALFPGSFDPFHNGHRCIMEQAAELFEDVTVLVCDNPNKKHLFDLTTRASMIQGLPVAVCNTSVADYARTHSYEYIIRGMDGDLFEQGLKLLDPSLKLIYFPRGEASSSIIRSLVGLPGWVKAISPLVDSHVMCQLKYYWLQKLVGEKAFKHAASKLDRPYHNLTHAVDVFYKCTKQTREVALAALYHDTCGTPEESVCYYGGCSNIVMQLIRATDHLKEVEADSSGIIAADLSILSSEWPEYKKYVTLLREEYPMSDEDWGKLRSEFMSKLLETRKGYLPAKARDNIRREISEY